MVSIKSGEDPGKSHLEAGLAVIATDTAGQQEVLQQFPKAGQVIPASDPIALAQAINYWLQQPDQLSQAKQAAKQAGLDLGWDTQATKLVHQVNIAIGQKT
ncbi:MAG: glycosyltransferase family 4 protein [Alkalinema sp. RL_2_19]|nr:glycosyltransferase family 4 protein [Alkalinema sp. RL_2_19]